MNKRLFITSVALNIILIVAVTTLLNVNNKLTVQRNNLEEMKSTLMTRTQNYYNENKALKETNYDQKAEITRLRGIVLGVGG